MSRTSNTVIRITTLAVGVGILGACGPKSTPPPPPPPPPPVERVPYRPLPPNQASYVMEIPRLGADGIRQTPNTGISDDERVWYFRSAWNVAALNCLGAQHQPILDGYSGYIKTHARALKAANDRIDAAYAKKSSSKRAGVRTRESRMTLVYNFFALPPARGDFCQSALDISNRYLAGGKIDPTAFAHANFSLFEQPFENFFSAYEKYERDSTAWDAQYGSRYGSSQPGYLAVQRARGSHLPTPGVSGATQLTSNQQIRESTVVDPTTGASIPVAPIDTTRESVPVVQPVPTKPG